jgi:hypothetical protein
MRAITRNSQGLVVLFDPATGRSEAIKTDVRRAAAAQVKTATELPSSAYGRLTD